GCVGQTVQPVSILPQISEFPYFQNFEGTSGWVQGGVRSSWEVGTPSGPVINSAYSGSNAWVTNLDGTYDTLENSYVLAPSFDLRSLQRPMLSMAILTS